MCCPIVLLRFCRLALLMVTSLVSGLAAADGVWRVDLRNCVTGEGEGVIEGEGFAENIDGLTWETAFCNIQDAIEAAHGSGGGEVWIAQGEYSIQDNNTGVGTAIRLRDDISLVGGFAGFEASRDERDLAHSTTSFNLIDLGTLIAIRVGSNTNVEDISFFQGRVALSVGQSSNVIVRACNFSNLGTAVAISNSTDVLIEDCNFTSSNRRDWQDDTTISTTGLVWTSGRTTIRNCTFTDNKGRALRMRGNVLVENCIFRNNEGGLGGAMVAGGSGGIVRNCLFEGNKALEGGAIIYGGNAVQLDIPPPPTEPAFQVINCIFRDNQALFDIEGETLNARAIGGAVSLEFLLDDSPIDDKGTIASKSGKCLYGGPCLDYVLYSPVLIAGSVFHNNHADGGGAAISSDRIWPVVVNSIEWENGDTPYHIASPDQFGIRAEDYPSFSYCILSEFPGGIGDENIIGDPLFVDLENGDYRLLPQSPAVDAGRALSDPLYGAVILDFAGNPRGVPATTSPGGDGSFYDIGAFELASPFHSADRDGSGTVNLSEILRVIQLFNSPGLHCDAGSEDGYAIGVDESAQDCAPHSSDYTPQDWQISLSEVLRAVQIYNGGAYFLCAEGEDGFCVGAA